MARLFERMYHVMQRREDKEVGLPVESRVLFLQSIQYLFGKLEIGHGEI